MLEKDENKQKNSEKLQKNEQNSQKNENLREKNRINDFDENEKIINKDEKSGDKNNNLEKENKSKSFSKNETKNKKDDKKNNGKNTSRKNKIVTSLAVACSVLALSTISLGVGLGVSLGQSNDYKTELENVYQSNFYSLVDSVNNLETKLSKTLSSSSNSFQRKTLLQASKNASEAEISMASLPLNFAQQEDLTKLVNQISGYTSTLAENLAKGESLQEDDMSTLNEVYESVVALKTQLNEFARRINNGYSIVNESLNIDKNGNEFSKTFSGLKVIDVDYPTMIYDGPFSDSVVNSTIKGLSGEKVTKSQAMKNVEKYFASLVNIEYTSQTNGRFDTFNFNAQTSDNQNLFVQVSQIGGNILTVSGAGKDGDKSIDYQSAKTLALKFAQENGIENPVVVWSTSLDNDLYLNITPTQNGIILYPDLVKVKVDLVSGTIIGYDSTSYFTNHIQRNLSTSSISQDDARGRVPSTFEIISSREVVSPLEYNREVQCIEVHTKSDEGEFYFYFNSSNGELENVLKVIETDNGNLLM